MEMFCRGISTLIALKYNEKEREYVQCSFRLDGDVDRLCSIREIRVISIDSTRLNMSELISLR